MTHWHLGTYCAFWDYLVSFVLGHAMIGRLTLCLLGLRMMWEEAWTASFTWNFQAVYCALLHQIQTFLVKPSLDGGGPFHGGFALGPSGTGGSLYGMPSLLTAAVRVMPDFTKETLLCWSWAKLTFILIDLVLNQRLKTAKTSKQQFHHLAQQASEVLKGARWPLASFIDVLALIFLCCIA